VALAVVGEITATMVAVAVELADIFLRFLEKLAEQIQQ
jgi:hypothetical protein